MKLEQAYAALRFDPALPWWALALLAGLCLLALAPALWRRARGAVWRALAFAVLLAWLSGPRLVRETRDTLPDIGLLVIDRSASMAVGDRARLAEAARTQLQAQAARMTDLELRTIEVPEAGHDGTRMFAAIERALADIPRTRLAGVLAVTDGQVHDGPVKDGPVKDGPAKDGPAKDGPDQALPAPLHVLIPADGEETDRRLRIVEAPTFGLVGKSVTVRLAVEDLGVARAAAGPGTARLVVRRDGEAPVIQTVPIGQETSVEVPIPRAGPIVVELQADALPGEVSPINNRAVLTINGVRDRLRVLLVSGEPHQGERTWRRLLKADPAVDLVHFTILRPPDRDDMTPLNELALIAFPVRELFQVKIREFDLIILDRFQNRGILPPVYLRNIADYVRGGGGLLLSAGPEFTGATSLAATAVGGVLPARPGPVVDGAFRPQVTALGARHPVTEGLPGAPAMTGAPAMPGGAAGSAAGEWGSWYRYVTPLSTTVPPLMATPDGSPLLLLDRVEQGRVALLLSDQIWLWSRGHQGGGPQAELLRRIAHWLMKETALDEEALQASIEDGVLHVERRTMEDGPPGQVTVISPAGATSTAALAAGAPGRSSVAVPAAELGVYQVSDGSHVAYTAATVANPREIADLRATATVLQPVARASGGSVRFVGARGGVVVPELRRTEPGREAAGGSWIGLPRRRDHVVTGLDAVPLLPPWAALPVLLALVVMAWRQEGEG
ncbi:MAG: hypothetical protein ACRYGM_24215 [Janthinobacterium lividum]